jgi:hypothetical protein
MLPEVLGGVAGTEEVLSSIIEYVEKSEDCKLPSEIKDRILNIAEVVLKLEYYRFNIGDDVTVQISRSMVASALTSFIIYAGRDTERVQYEEWGKASIRGQIFRILLEINISAEYPKELEREIAEARECYDKLVRTRTDMTPGERPYSEKITAKVIIYFTGDADTCRLTPMVVLDDGATSESVNLPVLSSLAKRLSEIEKVGSIDVSYDSLDLEEKMVYRLVNKQISLRQCRQVLAWIGTKSADEAVLIRDEDPLVLVFMMQVEYVKTSSGYRQDQVTSYGAVSHEERFKDFHFLTLPQVDKVISIYRRANVSDSNIVGDMRRVYDKLHPGESFSYYDVATAMTLSPELRNNYQRFVDTGEFGSYIDTSSLILDKAATKSVLMNIFVEGTFNRAVLSVRKEADIRNRLRRAVLNLDMQAYVQGPYFNREKPWTTYDYLACELTRYERRDVLASLLPEETGVFVARNITESHFIVMGGIHIDKAQIVQLMINLNQLDVESGEELMHISENETGVLEHFYPRILYRVIIALRAIKDRRIPQLVDDLLKGIAERLDNEQGLRDFLNTSSIIQVSKVGHLKKGTPIHNIESFHLKLWIALGAFYAEVAKERGVNGSPKT